MVTEVIPKKWSLAFKLRALITETCTAVPDSMALQLYLAIEQHETENQPPAPADEPENKTEIIPTNVGS